MKTHCNSFYGSNLWNLEGEKAGQVFNAWDTSVEMVWGCSQQTRTYFLQQILCCGFTSAKVDILVRYVKFFHSLRDSSCHEVQVISRLLARDVQSVIGNNLRYIKAVTMLNPWTVKQKRLREVLVAVETVEVPNIDRWRLPCLVTLLNEKRNAHLAAMEDEEERLSGLINSLVIN